MRGRAGCWTDRASEQACSSAQRPFSAVSPQGLCQQ